MQTWSIAEMMPTAPAPNSDRRALYWRRLLHGHSRRAGIRLLVGAPLLSLVIFASRWGEDSISAALSWTAAAVFFGLALLLALAELKTSGRSPLINQLGIVVDIAAVSSVMMLGGALASPLWLAYLWLLADGARYCNGRNCHLSVLLSLGGFSLVLLGNEYWAQNSLLGLSVLLLLAFFSPYYARRLPAAANHRPTLFTSTTGDDETDPGPALSAGVNQPQPDGSHSTKLLHDNRILLLCGKGNERQMITDALNSWGAESCVFSNVARSLAALIDGWEQGRPFHSMLVVHGRFELDSRQLAICIRSEPALQELTLIHIGATPKGQLSEQLRMAGYSRLLAKPLDKTLLFDALHNLQPAAAGNQPRVVRLLDHYSGRKTRQPLSVLLADHNRNDQRRCKQILQQAGHQVFVVEDGMRILDALDNHYFDIAVVAMELPRVGGLEAIKLYRFTRIDQPWTPFIVLLDQASEDKLRECQESGISNILLKNQLSTQLAELVDNAVQANLRDNLGRGSLDSGTNLTRAIVINGLTLDGQRLHELDRLGKGGGFLASLIDNFNEESGQILHQLELALRDSDVARFHDLGHTIKDSAGNLGTLGLYQLGVRATRIYPSDFPDNARILLTDLEQCCHDTHRALRQYLASRETFASWSE